LLKRLVAYYGLERAVMGNGGVKRELILYSGVAAGTVGRWLFDLVSGGSFEIKGLVLGLIASVVTFPFIYYNAGMDKAKANFVKWCVAFQNGFFWAVLLAGVTKKYGL
jgi:hypothetical protein